MSAFASLRISEWWEHKLPPLLAVGYASALFSGQGLLDPFPRLLLAIAGFILSAAFVSTLNDLTDLKADKQAGKRNRMAGLSKNVRIILFSLITLLCAGYLYWIRNDFYSAMFMAAALLSYILYSTPPFRLKKRGVAGLIADACGAHLFAALFFASMTLKVGGKEHIVIWLSIIAVWSLAYGIRGILWHQLIDRPNDEKSGIKTAGVLFSNRHIRTFELAVFGIEISSLVFILIQVDSILPFVAFLPYIIMLISYYRRGVELILAQADTGRWHILMSDYYQIYLPISLILAGMFANPYAFVLIIFHILAFPVRIKAIVKDIYGMLFADARNITGT